MRIGRDEAIERATTVTHHDLQIREAIEDVAMREELGRQVLLPDETDLVVLRDDANALVLAVGAVHDDRQAALLALGVDRVPIVLVHAGSSAQTLGVRSQVDSLEA